MNQLVSIFSATDSVLEEREREMKGKGGKKGKVKSERGRTEKKN